jgi:cytochrome oxidase Cu insertion factor (SCO1/SenC/PrrC family)
MRNMTRPRKSLPLIAAAALLIGAAAVLATASFASGRLGQNANIPLITQDGRTVHFYDDLFKGKIVAVSFIYTSCLFACPLETARLVQVQRMLGDRVGKNIFFYSISIDPDHDTPAVLKDYAAAFGVGPGWTFLTGNRADIDLLAVRLGLTDDPSITSGPGRGVAGYTPHLLIGNEPTGQWLRDSSADNPSMLAHLLVTFVGGGQGAQSADPSHSKPRRRGAAAAQYRAVSVRQGMRGVPHRQRPGRRRRAGLEECDPRPRSRLAGALHHGAEQNAGGRRPDRRAAGCGLQGGDA